MEIKWLAYCYVITGISAAITLDCNRRPGEEQRLITITEIDPIDTILVTFNNSDSDLIWSVSIQGTNRNYLSLFFKSNSIEGASQTHGLALAKILDLELLQLELTRTKTELFEAINGYALIIDLNTTCKTSTGRTQVWTFKVKVEPENEFIPQFMGAPFQVAVSESISVGTDIFNIGSRADDQDAGLTNLTFAIAPYVITQFDGSRYVTMSLEENGVIQLAYPLDFETFLKAGRTFMFVNVTVTDDGGFTSATSINVSVTDDNDQSVQFVYPGCVSPCLDANYTVLTNESYIGPLTVDPVQVMVRDLDTINEPIIYSLVSGDGFFRIDSSTGILYKIAALVNDTYGSSVPLIVKAREESRADHSVETTVIVQISDRMTSIYAPVHCEGICTTVSSNRTNPYQQGGNLLQRLQDVETKQGLADKKVARLEHLAHVQANIIKEQKSSLDQLESFVRKEMSRTAHASRMARQNRHKTSLILKALQQNNIDVERLASGNHHALGNHNAPGKQNVPGNHRAPGNHRTPGNHHGHKGSSVDLPSFFQRLRNGRQHNGKNTNGRTHTRPNKPGTSQGNKNQHHPSGSHNSGHAHDKTDSPSRHEHNSHPKAQQTKENNEQKPQEVASKDDHDAGSTPQ